VYVRACMCVCVREREREKERRKCTCNNNNNHNNNDSIKDNGICNDNDNTCNDKHVIIIHVIIMSDFFLLSYLLCLLKMSISSDGRHYLSTLVIRSGGECCSVLELIGISVSDAICLVLDCNY